MYVETVTLLYAPTYALSNIRGFGNWNLRFLGDNGPAQHLRHVRIEFNRLRYRIRHQGGKFDPAPTMAADDMLSDPYAKPYTETVLRALAQSATQLETLEFTMKQRDPFRRLVDLFGWPPQPHYYSWMDPPTALPPPLEGRIEPPYASEDVMNGILDFLAPNDEAMHSGIRNMIETEAQYMTPGSIWESTWVRIWMINGQKLFWGGVMMDVFKAFSPTLRTVSIVGGLDMKWMAAVANLINVTVRAKDEWADAEWLTVQPGSASC